MLPPSAATASRTRSAAASSAPTSCTCRLPSRAWPKNPTQGTVSPSGPWRLPRVDPRRPSPAAAPRSGRRATHRADRRHRGIQVGQPDAHVELLQPRQGRVAARSAARAGPRAAAAPRRPSPPRPPGRRPARSPRAVPPSATSRSSIHAAPVAAAGRAARARRAARDTPAASTTSAASSIGCPAWTSRAHRDRLGQVGDRQQRDRGLPRLRMQRDLDLGDHPERALAAGEQRRQVVAAVVLARPADRAHDPTVGEDRRPARAPARASSRRRRRPSRRRSSRPSRRPWPSPGRRGRHRSAAPLRGHARRARAAVTPAPTTTVRSSGVHRIDPVQARGQQQQGRPIGHRPTDQAGVAALDLHGDARRPRRHQHRRDLLGRASAGPPRGPDRSSARSSRRSARPGRRGRSSPRSRPPPGRRRRLVGRAAGGRAATPRWTWRGASPGGVVRRIGGRGHGDILPRRAPR